MNERCKDAAAAAILFLVLGGLYLGTGVPSILFEDTGEFVSGSVVLGVAHPPGYPLYLILGHLWSLLPVSETGFALVVFSALAAAAGCAVVFMVCRALGLARAASFTAAAVLGFSRTLWSQAAIPEVYGLNVLLMASTILVLVALVRKKDARMLALAYMLLALNFLNHYIAFFTFLPAILLVGLKLREAEQSRAPVWLEIVFAGAGALAWAAAFALAIGPFMGLRPVWCYVIAGVGAFPAAFGASLIPSLRLRIPGAVQAGGALLLGSFLTILLYLPLRSVVQPALNWDMHQGTFRGFYELLRRTQFTLWENQLSWFHWPTKLAYFKYFAEGLPREFTAIFVFLGILGVLLLAMERRRVFLFLLWLIGIQTAGLIFFINFHYALHQIFVFQVFFIGAYLVFAVFVAAGFDRMIRQIRESAPRIPWAPAAVSAGLLLLAAWPLVQNLPYNQWQMETRPLRFARDNFRVIHRDGVYFVQGSISVPVVGYAYIVDRNRQDVLLIDNHGTLLKQNYKLYGHTFSFVNMTEIFHDIAMKSLPERRVYSTGEMFPQIGGLETFNWGPLFEVGRQSGCDLSIWDGPEGDYSIPGLTRDFNTDTLEVLIAANWAQCDFIQGRNQSALLRLARVGDRMEGSALISIIVGTLLQRYDSSSSAEQMYQKALEFCPTYSQAYSKLGDVYLQRGEFDKSKENYRAALKLTPNKLDAMLNLANLYQQSSEYDKALKLYKDVLVIEPDASAAYNNMGLTYELMGRWDDAERAYKKAIRLSPDMALFYNGLGTFYLKRGRLWDALTNLKKHVALQPDSTMGYYNIGLVYEQMGDYNTAADYFKKAAGLPVRGSLSEGIALTSLNQYYALCIDGNLCRDQAEAYLAMLAKKTDEPKLSHNAGLLLEKMNKQTVAPDKEPQEMER